MVPSKRLNYCCCFSVRTGALILGVFGLLGSLSHLATLAGDIGVDGQHHLDVSLNQLDRVLREWREHEEITTEQLEMFEDYMNLARQSYPYFVAMSIAVSFLGLLKSSLLIGGVLYRKSALLLPHIILELFALFVATLAAIGGVALICLYVNLMVAGAAAIFFTLCLCLNFYFWHVVVSHYYEIREGCEDRLPIVIQEVPPAYENILNKY